MEKPKQFDLNDAVTGYGLSPAPGISELFAAIAPQCRSFHIDGQKNTHEYGR